MFWLLTDVPLFEIRRLNRKDTLLNKRRDDLFLKGELYIGVFIGTIV